MARLSFANMKHNLLSYSNSVLCFRTLKQTPVSLYGFLLKNRLIWIGLGVDTMASQDKQPIKSLETTMDIIDKLREKDGAGVTALANELGKSKSGVHHHLTMLERRGYVVNEDGQYRIGLKFLELGGYIRYQMEIQEIAKPEVKKLAEDTEELANLLVEEHGYGVYLYRTRGSQAVNLETYAGKRSYLHTTALGKAILANLARERVEEIIDQRGLPKLTENTITERDDLFEELETIREEGFAFDREEQFPGLRCVAKPITDNDGNILAAISAAGPSSRISDERFTNTLPKKVQEAANVIELNITHS